jgi:hypothetical protein
VTEVATTTTTPPVRLGLRANLARLSLLVVVNALVGGTIRQERTVLPLLAERTFGLTAYAAGLSFIVAFGVTKAVANLAAGPCQTGSAASRSSSPAGSSPGRFPWC